ncbi:MAG: hypothetical protein JWQ32_2077 [Marmoricola sp.]|nr:hypothetical protein [Marmoricola sp.]
MGFRNRIVRVSQLVADSLTGATISTAASGTRWVIGGAGVLAQTIRGYTGIAGETQPAELAFIAAPGNMALALISPIGPSGASSAIELWSDNPTDPGKIDLFAGGHDVTVDTSGLRVDGENVSLRLAGSSISTDNGIGISTETLRLVTPAIAAVNGVRYRIVGKCNPGSNVAGDFTQMKLKFDTVAAGITGTIIDNAIKDHRIANRPETLMSFGEFTYGGVTGTNIFAKMTLFNGGTGTGTDYAGTYPVSSLYIEAC